MSVDFETSQVGFRKLLARQRLRIEEGLLPFRFVTIPEEVFELIHEFMDIFELAIDGGEPNVRDSVQTVKFLHHLFAHLRTLDLALPSLLEIEFDPVDDLFNDVDTDRPLFARLLQTIEDLEAIEGFPSTVLLDHGRESLLSPLARGKPLLAAEAFSPSPDRLFVLALPGIDDLAFTVMTEWAFHIRPLLGGWCLTLA